MVGTLTTPAATPEVRQKTSISLSELRPAGDRYYSVGDYLVSVRLAEFLGQRGKPFQVIGDRSAAYKDLRGQPAVLIGQFNNLWTMGLTGNLRYYIDRSSRPKAVTARLGNSAGCAFSAKLAGQFPSDGHRQARDSAFGRSSPRSPR